MSELATWLRRELQKRGLSQNRVAVYTGVGVATVNGILTKGHIPKVETLFRLADYFETSREQVLRLAGHLPPLSVEAEGAVGPSDADEVLLRELIAEFRQLPDEWKPAAIEQVATFRRLAELRPPRVVGEEPAEGEAARGEAAAEEEAA